ncbi:peroxisome biogenesis factor 1 isoform X1 [Gadus macrocephalus]|uniref:peroxisome biogenesis factor 1 isoform X1 n=1 Tax=Gadus macrocephalus TaxID=80720 RepID=UPI0028CB4A56|nr:peroxisome biogenesis factor 1 isoform X1 [Gadus macrocephalus]
MFVNQGIQPVTVVFNNAKNCFLHLPPNVISHLSLHENQALELSWGHGSPVFLSWTRSRRSSKPEEHIVELCRQLGERLGLKEGEQGFLRPCQQVSSVHQVFVEPLSSDDWEILELHSAALEQQLLDQIRVVFKDAVFPVWVDQRTAVYIRIASLEPAVPHGRLERSSELVVSPKTRPGTGSFLRTPPGSGQDPTPYRHPSSEPPPSSPRPPSPAQNQQWGGIGNLTGLMRYLFTGAVGPAKETMPSVPELPALFSASLLRVCHQPPNALCTINPGAAAVVHLFPWNETVDTGCSILSQSAVTYGLLSKIPTPKEARDGAKRATEPKKNAGALKVGEELAKEQQQEEVEEGKELAVVRVVCHHVEELQDDQNRGEIHSGRVWITQHLATSMKIDPHSTVRIQPVESTVTVASGVRLQPLEPLPEESDDAIQTAFLDWLHSQSHEPLACLTARSSIILLHGPNAKLELALTVLQPEAESELPDQLFLLAPAVLQKAGVQVDRGPPTADTTTKVVADAPYTELPLLGTLGGTEQLSKAGFQFMSHSLLGSPLSRELGALGQGLHGGALLITGAKGSGKSAVSRALCRKAGEELDTYVEVVDCKKLKGKRAETVRHSLEETFQRARWRQPSVVLLDDLDHVTGAATTAEHEHGPEALLRQHIAQSLIDIVDDLVVRSSLVCLVVTSQTEHSLHPSLTDVQGSHFFQGFLHIQPPDQAQRAEILRRLVLQKPCLSAHTADTLDLGAVAMETDGYLARDLALLLERAVHASAVREERSDQAGDGLCLRWSHFEQAMKGFTPPSLWGVRLETPPGVGLDRVGGLKEVRQELMDTVLLPAKYPVLFSRLPIRHRSGLLLYGAPGTGKTLLAGAAARDSGMNFISIKGPELLSKYIGASEQGVRDVFQRAQAASPCILFFDEFDSLAPRRGHDSTGVTDRVVNQLLTQLDGVEGLQGVYVLAASSRPDMIDPALLRPGRLDKSLYCPPPDVEDRVEILQALSGALALGPDVDLRQLAEATELFTGADLKALLYNAQLEALHAGPPPSPALQEPPACGSDSDGSLSSMIFLNNSSASEDSLGEAEPALSLDQSMVFLEHSMLPAADPARGSNAWRLYFGSSYESELGHASPSPPNSLCASGPGSTTQESSAGALARESAGSLPPACMPTLRGGFQELGPEELQRLLLDVGVVKGSYRRTDVSGRREECVRSRSVSGGAGLMLSQAHLTSALAQTRPSLGAQDWQRFSRLYEAFGDPGARGARSPALFKPGQRVTLA